MRLRKKMVLVLLLLFIVITSGCKKKTFEQACAGGSVREVKSFVEKGESLTPINTQGQTPLMIASAKNSRPEVIEYLVKAGANVHSTDQNGRTALMYAALSNANKDVLEVLIEAGANLRATDSFGLTALHLAIGYNSSKEVVGYLFNEYQKASLLGDNQNQKSLLLASLQNQNIDIYKFIKAGLSQSVSIMDSDALEYLAQNPSKEATLYLLSEYKVDRNILVNLIANKNPNPEVLAGVIKDSTNYTLNLDEKEFQEAVARRSGQGFVKAVLEGGASPKGLLFAIARFSDSPDAVNLALAKGAKLTAVNSENQLPLEIACCYNTNSSFIKNIFNKSEEAKCEFVSEDLLKKAVYYHNKAAVSFLLKQDIDLLATKNTEISLLQSILPYVKTSKMMDLILNSLGKKTLSPSVWFTLSENLSSIEHLEAYQSLAKYLAENKIYTRELNALGETVLTTMIKSIMAVDLDKSEDDFTFADLASRGLIDSEEKQQMEKLLAKYENMPWQIGVLTYLDYAMLAGCPGGMPNNAKQTPLGLLFSNSFEPVEEAINLFGRHKIDFNAYSEGLTLLSLFYMNYLGENSYYETSFNFELDDENIEIETPFDRIATLLSKYGAILSKLNEDGSNIIHTAAKSKAGYDMYELGAKFPHFISGKDNFGRTPLFYGALADDFDAVEALVQQGANINEVDEMGHTPLTLVAKETGSFYMLDHLLQLGANSHHLVFIKGNGYNYKDFLEEYFTNRFNNEEDYRDD